MNSPKAKSEMSHLNNVFGWSSTETSWRAQMIASAIAMAAPVLVGIAAGEVASGLVASVGALMTGAVHPGWSWRTQIREMGTRVVPPIGAVAIGPLAARHGWTGDLLVVLLAGVATILVGFGQPIAPMAIRFVTVLIIASAVIETSVNAVASALLILAGIAWAFVVNLIVGACARTIRPPTQPPVASSTGNPTLGRRVRRLVGSLKTPSGWQHAIRLTLCLVIAAGLKWYWPGHHLSWIGVTVALLIQRDIEKFPVRTTQRAVGTTLGVLATGLLLIWPPPNWAQVLLVGVLAGLAPLLRERSYLVYSMVMTPLIILVMDAGHPVTVGVLIDRFIATLIGAALVILANQIAKMAFPSAA